MTTAAFYATFVDASSNRSRLGSTKYAQRQGGGSALHELRTGYDHDFFVSYASVDDEPMPAAERGWVGTLIKILTSGSGLAGKLGRREAFTWWIDEQHLRGNHEVDEHIPDQVKRSALLLVVLSPGYAASKFCLLELETFLKSSGVSAERLFIVYKEQLVEQRHPMPESLRRPVSTNSGSSTRTTSRACSGGRSRSTTIRRPALFPDDRGSVKDIAESSMS